MSNGKEQEDKVAVEKYFMQIIDEASGKRLDIKLVDGEIVITGDLPPNDAFEVAKECFKMKPDESVPYQILVRALRYDCKDKQEKQE